MEGPSPHPSGIKHRKIVLMRDRAALDDIKLSRMGKFTWPFSHALSDGNMITGYGDAFWRPVSVCKKTKCFGFWEAVRLEEDESGSTYVNPTNSNANCVSDDQPALKIKAGSLDLQLNNDTKLTASKWNNSAQLLKIKSWSGIH